MSKSTIQLFVTVFILFIAFLFVYTPKINYTPQIKTESISKKVIMDDIYKMKLHEITGFDETKPAMSVTVIRVPGGWLYRIVSTGNHTTTFVAFNNEFQNKEKK